MPAVSCIDNQFAASFQSTRPLCMDVFRPVWKAASGLFGQKHDRLVCNSFRWENFTLIMNYNRACFHLYWWQIVLWIISIEIVVLVQYVWMGVPDTHGLFDFITTQHREREMDGFQISVCSLGRENINALNENICNFLSLCLRQCRVLCSCITQQKRILSYAEHFRKLLSK